MQKENGGRVPCTEKVMLYVILKHSFTLWVNFELLAYCGTCKFKISEVYIRDKTAIELNRNGIVIVREIVIGQEQIRSNTKLIRNSETCLSYRYPQAAKVSLKLGIPNQIWVKVGTDKFLFGSKYFFPHWQVQIEVFWYCISHLPDAKTSTDNIYNRKYCL